MKKVLLSLLMAGLVLLTSGCSTAKSNGDLLWEDMLWATLQDASDVPYSANTVAVLAGLHNDSGDTLNLIGEFEDAYDVLEVQQPKLDESDFQEMADLMYGDIIACGYCKSVRTRGRSGD